MTPYLEVVISYHICPSTVICFNLISTTNAGFRFGSWEFAVMSDDTGSVEEQDHWEWGPHYTAENSVFFGSKGGFYSDEVKDFLVGKEDDRPVFPRRLRGSKNEAVKRLNFARNVHLSSLIILQEGQHILYHRVKPGHRKAYGIRRTTFGWKVVVTKKAALHLIIRVSYLRCLHPRSNPRLHLEPKLLNVAGRCRNIKLRRAYEYVPATMTLTCRRVHTNGTMTPVYKSTYPNRFACCKSKAANT